MRALIDTHALVWGMADDKRLSLRAKRVMSGENDELYCSMVSLWEITLKMGKGKLQVLGSSIALVRDMLDNEGVTLLPIRFDHLLRLENLPHHHVDPFDRLLIAQAIEENLSIVTRDALFRRYRVQTIW